MQYITIEKKANGYTVEINGDYDEVEDELYLYKTREEMEADLVNVVARAHELGEQVKAAKEAKKNK